MSTKIRTNGLGRELCPDCDNFPHDGTCDPHDATVEAIRRIVAAGIAHRRDAVTTAREVAKALGL